MDRLQLRRTLIRLGALAPLASLGTGRAHAQSMPSDDELRRGGFVFLLRHSRTVSGIGDPPGFRLDQCSTQRNLDDAGREQSRRIGAWFRERRIELHEIRSSAWCRCRDTATLAFGRYEVWPALNSFFAERDPSQEAAQRREVFEQMAKLPANRNAMLVTHQFNISSLVGVSVSMGEGVIARPAGGRLEVVSRFQPGA